MIPAVDELGTQLEYAWRRVNFQSDAFASLAADALSRANLPDRVRVDELITLGLHGPLAPQADPAATFGQPPLTLFRTDRFYVDALFWVDGTTLIHDHAFSGAFQVMAGSSIETTFEFAPARQVDSSVIVGELHGQGSTLRQKGDVRAIPAGRSYIHSLFHLERPSVSLVIRTFDDPEVSIQYQYSPAGIAFNSFDRSEARDRAARTARLLRAVAHPRFEQLVGDAIASASFGTAFAMVRACSSQPQPVIESLIDRLKPVELRGPVRDWVAHRKRAKFIGSKRALVREPALRFMLAILLNAQTRADALRLAGSFSSDQEPATLLAHWLRELSGINARLTVAGVPFDANLLALPKFEPGHDRCLAQVLSGIEMPWSAPERAFIDQLRRIPYLSILFH